jgi:aldose sugar dehydrogenase
MSKAGTKLNGARVVLVVLFATAISTAFFPARKTLAPKETFVIDTLASGLTVPWDLVFLPNGDMLATERPGRVRIFHNDRLQPAPALSIDNIEVNGKMGLLGICLHPLFTANHFVYLAYNYRAGNETFLRIARYEWLTDSLRNPKTIIERIPGVFNHTGSRLKFGPDKKLYITTGDADIPRLAQDLKAFNGKILRLNDDGTIPADNPFVKNDTARHEIWTYGHRNVQGIAFQPNTGNLYNSEHGPTGGDEINLIRKGHNYGWPISHHREIQNGTTAPLMEFTPSIGPSEALFYTGQQFPSLQGHLLVACMRGEAILNISISNNTIPSYNYLFSNTFGRIRALVQGPDGSLYFSTTMVDPPEGNMKPGDNGVDLILRLRRAKPGEEPGGSLDTLNKKLTVAIFSTTGAATAANKAPANSKELYTQLCASCHGVNMQGNEKVPSLVDNRWLNGGTKPAIIRSITDGITAKGMPSWGGTLTAAQIAKMTDYILANKTK